MRLYFHLIGREELENGNLSEALEHFKKSVSLLPHQHSNVVVNDHAFFIDALALAYYMSGDLDKAQEEYERIISLTLGRLHWPSTPKVSTCWEKFLRRKTGTVKP